MPNRILRDWTDSATVSELDAKAERFFVRLIMKADDWGRFHADETFLARTLFPFSTDIRPSDVSKWLSDVSQAGLIKVYCDDRGRKLLEINNFNQRTRAKESKFPDPPSNDRHMTVTRPSNDGLDVVVFGDEDVFDYSSCPPSDDGEEVVEPEKPKKRKPKDDYSSHPRFEEWWETVPNRVNKYDAFQEWKKAVKLPGVDAETIIANSWKYAEYERKRLEASEASGGDYKKLHPCNWLKKRRWEDEFEPPAKPKKYVNAAPERLLR